jgi:hypothetical protein
MLDRKPEGVKLRGLLVLDGVVHGSVGSHNLELVSSTAPFRF